MKGRANALMLAAAMACWAPPATAQTAEEVIGRGLTALGGREALSKIRSRSIAGTITLSTPAGVDVTGPVEILNAAPNKVRVLLDVDLSALKLGQMRVDQRFDGERSFVLNSVQGDREVTGVELENLRNGAFPHLFLTYRQLGMSARLEGREREGDREFFVVTFSPPKGSAIRQYIDADTYLPARVVLTVHVPQAAAPVEQTTELSDYREVTGVKVPFRTRTTSPVQTVSIQVSKVQHNVPVDEALFRRPMP